MNTCIGHDDLLIVLVGFGLCLLILTLILLVVWRLLLGLGIWARRPYALKKRTLTYRGDVRRTLAHLQQLQAMIGSEAASGDPSLTDLARLLRSMQREYGRDASLEGVIQALVAQDLDRQLSAHKQRSAGVSRSVVTPEGAMQSREVVPA
jgi:hypothetical protein